MSIQFRPREFCYPFSILKLHSLFKRSQWWPLPDLLDYQEQLLQQTVTHAYQQVPYYQELFRKLHLTPVDIRTTSDLQKLPLLTKEILRKEYLRLQARNKNRFHPREHQTSGTSGEPVHFLLDKPANVLEFVYYWRHWSWAGYRLGQPFAELTSHYFLTDDKLARLPWYYQRYCRRLLLNSLSLSREKVKDYATAIRHYEPLFLKGIASALYFFALFLKEQGITDVTFRGIFSTAEMLLPSQRQFIEQVFHAKIYDSFGHMERTVAVSECPQGGFHVNPEYGVLEVVDKTHVSDTGLDRSSSGRKIFTGKVVGTSLHNRSMPLLRYEVGDLIEVEEPSAPCACGRTLPRIRRVNGRQEDVITTPDGRTITTLFIVFNCVPGISIGQIVQEQNDRMVVRIVPSIDYTPQREAELLGYLRRFVGPELKIRIECLSVEDLRRETQGKFRTVISLAERRTLLRPNQTSSPQVEQRPSVNPGGMDLERI